MSKNTLRWLTASGCCLIASACSSMPDVTATYYLPKTEVDVTVEAVVTCNGSHQVIIASKPSVVARHMADYTKPHHIEFEKLDSIFSNTSLTLEFYDDGRLKCVNSTSAGQCKEIVEAEINISSKAAAFGILSTSAKSACDYINDGNTSRDKSKTVKFNVTLTEQDLKELAIGGSRKIKESPETFPVYQNLKGDLGEYRVSLEKLSQPAYGRIFV